MEIDWSTKDILDWFDSLKAEYPTSRDFTLKIWTSTQMEIPLEKINRALKSRESGVRAYNSEGRLTKNEH